MSSIYTRALADGAKAIEAYGIEAVLIKPRAVSGATPYALTRQGAETRIPIKAMDWGIKQIHQGVGLVSLHMRVFQISGKVDVAKGDKIAWAGTTFAIKRLDPFAPGGIPLYYEAYCAG